MELMSPGFFDLGVSNAPKKQTTTKYRDCSDCGLFSSCENSKFPVKGQGKKKILIIGEHPSERDDSRGNYFSGKSGSYLWDLEDDLGINLEEDCHFVNAIRCCPHAKIKSDNWTKRTNKALPICRDLLMKTIEELQPEIIIPMGDLAVTGLIGKRISGRLKGTARSAFFGHAIPDQELKAWIFPTYSPTFINTQKNDRDYFKRLKKHIANAYTYLGQPLLKPYHKVHTTMDQKEAMEWLKKAKEAKSMIAFDYETTGIKPHRKGHRIVCASIAFDGEGYAFPWFNTPSWRQAWKDLLTSDKIRTVAHNLGFESIWTYVHGGLDYWPSNYGWDTCLAAHCINNQDPTSLKFHTYTELGIIGFDDDVDYFITTLKPGEEIYGSNGFNRIDECSLAVLLKYNAYDSLYTLQLQELQESRLNDKQMEGFSLFVQGAQTLATCQQHGMKVDIDEVNANMKVLLRKKQAIADVIMESDEVQSFDKNLDLASPTQLVKFFYDHLGFKVPPEGKKVDKKVLKKFDHPIVELLLRYRGLGKMWDFLNAFKKEAVDGIIHPAYNLNRVVTFRSSSSDPNFQNLPKHNKEANKYIRGPIKAQEGCKIVEYDYRGIEVAVGCTYHRDPTMQEYLEDESNNMHTDTACDLFIREKDTFLKSERQSAKNKMVFPEFYGSSAVPKKDEEYGVIARDLWDDSVKETKEHLASHGIDSLDKFQAHVIAVEEKMWGERFPVYAKWREEEWNRYNRKGYLDQYTGFRVHGPLRWTQAINTRTQGSAFHCLLFTMNCVAERIYAISGRSYVVGQIHDAIVCNVHPEDEEEVDRLIKYYGTVRTAERYPELKTVPLIIEKDASEIDGDWSNMTEIGPL